MATFKAIIRGKTKKWENEGCKLYHGTETE
mgnify:CR=1 FL=1